MSNLNHIIHCSPVHDDLLSFALLVYVDGLVIASNDLVAVTDSKVFLNNNFKSKRPWRFEISFRP